jgi:tetratricopeptide (TPR) repeat protein
MIKNEASNICATLEPLIKAGFCNFCIYDTGSTDNTVTVVNEYLSKQNVIYRIIEESFINFCESRNRLISLAKEHFSNSCRFAVSLDAEWYLTNGEKLISFLSGITEPLETYSVYIKDPSSGMVYTQQRVFNLTGKAYYASPVHEYVVTTSNQNCPEDIYFEWKQNTAGTQKTCERWYRDLSILMKEYHRNKDPRNVFYLGQTYDCLGDIENAIRYYSERSLMTNGFNEEKYMAFYRLGRLYEGRYLKYISENNTEEAEEQWNCALKAYTDAFQDRPSRVEPLIRCAMHYLEPHLKYMYAKQACITPYPSTDVLFIDKELYDYDRWDQLAIGAWYQGLYEEGYDALCKAMKIKTLPHHLQNDKLYRSQLFPQPVQKISFMVCILYNPTVDYEIEMVKCHKKHLQAKKIPHLFYCYRENQKDLIVIEDNILYIRGKETYIPGILEKTFKVFELMLQISASFNYVIRTNISTCINYDLLTKYLSLNPVDYGGPLYYNSLHLNPEAGVTEEFFKKHGNRGCVSGICIILSMKGLRYLLEKKDEMIQYGVVDDVAIGYAFRKHSHDLIDAQIPGVVEWEGKINPFNMIYRNKSENRFEDLKKIKEITHFLRHFQLGL